MSTVSRVRFFAAFVGIFGIVPTPVLAQSLSIPLPPLKLDPPFAQVSAMPTDPLCLPKADLETPNPESVASTAVVSPPAQLASPSPKQPTWRDSLQQGASWIDRSQTQLVASVQAYGTKVLAYTQASEWPALNDRAQAAKVPVMMYHDILPEKEVFFDVTIDELREHFELIKELDLNPISLGQLVDHLHLGTALPPKPIVLTFDDGYVGHYSSVYPLLKEYGYPATFSIFTDKVDGKIVGRSTVTWEQLQEMALDPLVTIAAHSVTHPTNLTLLELAQVRQEVENSKHRLEEKLGISIEYFTYPEGHYNETVAAAVAQAGYRAALTMDDWNEGYAGDSESLLAIDRFGQSRLWEIAPTASGGVQLPPVRFGFDFDSPVQSPQYVDIEDVPLILITGGRPITIHADSRYQVQEILASSEAIAGVDGAFFSLEFLDSNTIIGPVASQSTRKFVPGNSGENPLLNGRPLVLLNSSSVKFVPFDASRHNSLAGIRQEMADVTDAFVGAAWLVRDGQPQPPEAFGNLFDFDAARDRAFWGINRAGQPVVGVSRDMVDSVLLGELLAKAGFRDAIMLDSGASASLAYRGESLMEYIPRPVPHVVGLVPPPSQKRAEAKVNPCWMAKLE
jgi:peptidoglycan/xylan/chitin deacetylase (PgdA/CDA1 family)